MLTTMWSTCLSLHIQFLVANLVASSDLKNIYFDHCLMGNVINFIKQQNIPKSDFVT